MNWLFLIVVAVIGFSALNGFHKGMLRVAFGLIQTIVAIIFVIWATPYVSDFLVTHTDLETKIESRCNDYLHSYVEQKIEAEQINEKEKADVAREQLEEMGVFLPKSMIEKVDGTIVMAGDKAGSVIEASGVYQEVSHEFSMMAMKGITFIVTLLVTMIILQVLSALIKIVEKIPIISGTNKILGLLAGAFVGLLIVWIGFSVLAFTSTMPLGVSLLGFVKTNEFLTWLYQHNLVLMLLMLYL